MSFPLTRRAASPTVKKRARTSSSFMKLGGLEARMKLILTYSFVPLICASLELAGPVFALIARIVGDKRGMPATKV